MNFTHIDVGQLFIASIITIVGYLIKRELIQITSRLDKHDNIILQLVGDVQRLIGRSETWIGKDRRGQH